MTENNMEIGICNEQGFRKMTPSEIKEYLASILIWSLHSISLAFSWLFMQTKNNQTLGVSLADTSSIVLQSTLDSVLTISENI